MRKRDTRREMGAILVLFVLSLPALLGLSVLALDAGHLYLARSRLDKGSRIAAATALNIMALRGWAALATSNSTRDPVLGYATANAVGVPHPPENSINSALLEQVKTATDQTLQAYFPDDFKVVDGTTSNQYLNFVDPETKELKARPGVNNLDIKRSGVTFELEYAVPTVLLGSLSEITGGTQCSKSGSTTRCKIKSAKGSISGYLKPANIVLLLDTSGSMSDTVSGETKLTKLKQAVNTFIDMFNPNQDKIAVVRFGTTANERRPLGKFDDGNQNSGFLRVKEEIATLQAGGQTNPCDALLRAMNQLEKISRDDAKFVVLFTDGAPNVYRLSFDDTSKLHEALKEGGVQTPPTYDSEGWYGWTVKWGKRKLSSCPAGPSSTTSASDCDPVYGWPAVRDSNGQAVSLADIKNQLRLNEDGQFTWKIASGSEVPLGTDYALEWEVDDGNYKWYGPSYLVHGNFQIDPGASLIDRIPKSIVGSQNLITCGPGSRGSMPGGLWKKSDVYTEMYNHARYFASRVINKNWLLTGDGGAIKILGPDFSKIADPLMLLPKGGNKSFRVAAPGYFKRPPGKSEGQPLKDAENDENIPGCLSSLNAYLPGYPEAHIWVGKEDSSTNLNPALLSNPNSASVQAVGEVVKTAELPYYCAVRAADLLREIGVSVFTIGLGPSATQKYGAGCEDPMQNALDFSSRKDGFLKRVAYAPESLASPGIPNSGWSTVANFDFTSSASGELTHCTNHPLSGQKISRGFSKVQPVANEEPLADGNSNGSRFGSYYGSNDPSRLSGIFGRVAKEVLLRLAG